MLHGEAQITPTYILVILTSHLLLLIQLQIEEKLKLCKPPQQDLHHGHILQQQNLLAPWAARDILLI